MTKRDDDFSAIPLNGPFDDRTDPMLLEPGTNSDVVNIRRGFNDALMRGFPVLSGSMVTWATSSTPPLALVPCTVGPSFFSIRPDHPDYSITPRGAQRIGSTTITYPTGSRSNAWFPAQVLKSRTVSNYDATDFPVSAVARTQNFKAVAVKRQGDDVIELTVEDNDGNIIVANKVVATVGTLSHVGGYPIHLTAHSADRVALWYHVYTAGAVPTIYFRLISLTGTGISIGVERFAGIPAHAGPFAVASEGNNTTGFVLHGADTPSSAVRLSSLDVTAGTLLASTSSSGEIGGPDTPMSLSYLKRPGSTDLLAMGWVSGSGVIRGAIVDTSATTVNAARTRNLSTSYSDRLVVCWTNLSGSGAVPLWISSNLRPSTGSLAVTMIVADYSSLLVTNTIPGIAPISQAANWLIPGSTTTVPLIPMSKVYLTGSNSVLDPNYVQDQSVEVYSANQWLETTRFVLTPVARLGVNTAFGVPRFPLGGINVRDNEASVVYPTFDGSSARIVASSARLTDVRLWSALTASNNPGLVPYAAPGGHASVIGSAMPVAWDGREITEAGFMHRPLLSGSNTGGSGAALNGTFTWYARYGFTDNAGQKRRSAPSNAFTTTLSAQAPRLYVSQTDSFRNDISQGPVNIELYGTDGSGSIAYRLDDKLIPISSLGSGDSTKVYNTVVTGVVGNPVLETLAGALEAECPPAIWDVCAVDDRLWAIDAENRERIIFTKTKDQGIAFEWNGALETYLGNDAGRAIAIKNVNGNPIILAERGIYAIYGEGPDNTGGGPAFNDPVLVSPTNVHPNSRNSAVMTPQGLLFETTRGHALFNGQSVVPLDGVLPPVHGRMSTIVSERCSEVHRLDGQNTFTWNWRNGHTSRWFPSQLSGSAWLGGLVLPPTGSGGEPMVLASDRSIWFSADSSSGNSDPWSITTGWLTPAGLNGRANVKEYWLNGRLNETGSQVTVREFYNWSPTSGSTKTWVSSSFAAACPITPGIASLRGQPAKKEVVSVRLVLSGTVPEGGKGFVPMSLDIEQEMSTTHNTRKSTFPR